MSSLRVTSLRGRTSGTSPSLPDGAIVTGVVTATTFSGNITGVAATFTGNVSVGGVLTYEDVTSIDSIGIITARSHVSIADSILHTGDTDTSIRFPAADTFTVETGGSERIRVDSGGRLGIGTATPSDANSNADNLVILATGGGSGITIFSDTDNYGNIYFGDSDHAHRGRVRYEHSNDALTLSTAATERVRVDSSGRLLVGTTSSSQNATIVAQGNSDSATSSAELYMQRGQSSPNDGATFATIVFGDSGGGQGAAILSQRDGGTWSGSSKPGRLIFSTTSDGASSPTERLRIDSTGNLTSTGTVSDSKGELRKLIPNTQSSAYTAVASDAGKYIWASGTVTIPNNVFSAGDMVTIVNDTSSNLTITNSLSVMYMSSDGTNAASRTLSAHGMATLLFVSATVAYISGAGLS